jgi:hypothetical protein
VNFNLMNLAGLGVVILCALLMVIFRVVYRKQPLKGLRLNPAFNRLRQAIGLAVEDGSRLHVSLGNASPYSQQSASGLVGLSALERITQLSAASDQPPVATSGDGGMAVLSQDILRASYRRANTPSLYDPTLGRMSGPTPFSYIAGALPVMHDEDVSANIFLGSFGPEVALLVDTAEQENNFTLAGSDSLPAQAVLYATTREPIIGEELFASGASLQTNPFHPASLRAQDVLRWLIFLSILAGALLKLLGIIK